MRYLLDTNMVSDLVRNPQGKVPARIARVGEESVCTSITVAAELRYGAARKGSTRLLAQLLTVLDAFEILPRGASGNYLWRIARPPGSHRSADRRERYANRRSCGLPGHTIVTDHEREFSQVDGLSVENWLRL